MKTFTIAISVLLLSGCLAPRQYVSGEGLAADGQAHAACNDLEQLGQEVYLTTHAGLAPDAHGGEITDGTYILTDSALYTADSPTGTRVFAFGKTTMLVGNGLAQVVITSATGKVRRSTVRRVQAGALTTSVSQCSSPIQGKLSATTVSYTATKDVLLFINPGPAGTVVTTYTKK